MRKSTSMIFGAVAVALVSCGKPDQPKKAGDPCDSAQAQPPLLTQEQAIKACKDNRKFVGAPAKRSNIQITNH
jgi:hypothetical protein